VLTALGAAVACVSDAQAAEGHGRPGPRPWNSSATDAVPAKQGANIHGQALEAQLFAGFKEPTAKQSAARAALPQNVKQALTNLKAGKMSVEDCALLASNPEYTKLADALVQRVTTGKSSVEAKTNAALSVRGSAAAPYCRGFSGWVDAKSWISGAWLYQWAQRLDVCYDGSAVTSLNSRYYTVGHRDWAWKDQGLLSDSPGSLGGWQYQSYMRGHMEMCIIKFGCTTDQYPWVRIIAYGNGTASITSGK
jgi:hypothetical protein